MGEYTVPEQTLPDREFWNKTYEEFNARRQGAFYSAQQVAYELGHYARIRSESGRGIRILDIGGAEGEVLCKALETVPELQVELVTVVEPSKTYVDLYSENMETLNKSRDRDIAFEAVVDEYNFTRLKKIHDERGLAAVPEIRDNFLKTKTGHFLVISSLQSLVHEAQEFASYHYKLFYPGMIPSNTRGSELDFMHFAIHDNCYMKCYQELFDVGDLVYGDDIASGNEKGRNFLRFLMQRDLGADTKAGDLELRVYLKWVKNRSIPVDQYLNLERVRLSETPESYSGRNGTSLKSCFLACWVTLFRLTSESMAGTLTVESAHKTNSWRNEIHENSGENGCQTLFEP